MIFTMFDLEESASHPLPLLEGMPQVRNEAFQMVMVRSTLLHVTRGSQTAQRGFLLYIFLDSF